MDDDAFDRLTRLLAGRRTRRSVAATTLGLIGAGIAIVPEERASAIPVPSATPTATPASRRTCRRDGQSCTRGAQCCAGICPTGRDVPRARRNRCGCGSGTVVCDGACVHLSTTANCLACGDACKAGELCGPGGCYCPDNEPLCAPPPPDPCRLDDSGKIHAAC